MIPLAIPNIGPLEGRYLQACVDENFVSTVGRFVSRFESEVAALSGTEQAAAMGSGTQALHIALRVMGVKPGDLVIVPSFTFIATANAVAHCGATPWFVDIENDSWTLDPARVDELLATHTEQREGETIHLPTGHRVAAIVPVYTLGTPADMDRLSAIASRYGLAIVADAAAAIGVTYRGRPIGGLADLTAYSFNGNKTITSGGGGALVGKDSMLVQRARHISSTARITSEYDHDDVGYNYRMTNVEAAIGCAQMERLGEFLIKKASIRRRYDDAFANIAGIQLFPRPSDRESTFWFSGVVLAGDHLPTVRAICAQLAERDIEARPFWKPVHLQKPYAASPKAALPITDGLWRHIITLPCSTSLGDDDQDKVITAVTSILTGS